MTIGRGGWSGNPRAVVSIISTDIIEKVGSTNAEMRWEAMRDQSLLVPNERFFVRNYTAAPRIDAATWRLRMFGSGLRRPEGIELSYGDLARLGTREITAAIECAGNGRRFFGEPDTVPFNDNGYQFWAVVRHPVRVL